MGYHSIWFQNILLNECPFHNISLEEKCPRCGQVIPYEIDKKNNRSPFRCFCGYSYFDNNKNIFFIQWTNHDIKIKSKSLLSWLNLNCKDLEKFRLIYFDKKLAKINNNNTINLITSVLNSTSYSIAKVNNTISSIPNIVNIKNNYADRIPSNVHELNNIKYKILLSTQHKDFEQKVNYFYSEMFKSYKLIFSSVSRYVRKKLNYKNKKHIKKLLRDKAIYPNPKEYQINLYACSCIMWKKVLKNYYYLTPFKIIILIIILIPLLIHCSKIYSMIGEKGLIMTYLIILSPAGGYYSK